MRTPGLRLVLIAFPLLSVGVATNLFLLQPRVGRLATVTLVPPQDVAGRVSNESRPAVLTRANLAVAAPRPAAVATADTADTLRAIRRELNTLGYEAGSADAAPDLVTRAAILAYEHDHGLPLTAESSEQLLKTILLKEVSPRRDPSGKAPAVPGPQAQEVIRSVQQALTRLGYISVKADGRLGSDTTRAIREFEIDQSLPETGRISGQLVARLARLSGRNRVAAGR